MSYLLEDWERVDEVNLLSILVHINPCKFYSYQPFLYRIHSCFAKFTMFFPIEPRVQCRLRLIHIQSADAMLSVYRTVWETKTHSHRHRHSTSRAHRKRDIKNITVGSFFYSATNYLVQVHWKLIENNSLFSMLFLWEMCQSSVPAVSADDIAVANSAAMVA